MGKKPEGTVYFSMEYQIGSGDDWVQRKSVVLNHKTKGFVLYTSTVGLNHDPRYFAALDEAIAAGMAFAQTNPT